MKIHCCSTIVVAAVFLIFFTMSSSAPPACSNPAVQNNQDSGPGSLRYALANATNSQTITFCPSVSGSIKLTSARLTISNSVTILGPGANLLAIDGNNSHSVFVISPGLTVTIAGLTISNGQPVAADESAGGINNNHATLTVSNCIVSGNGGNYGGGIYNNGLSGNSVVKVYNSTISGNFAGFGGGLFNDGRLSGGNATMQVFNSTISSNSTSGSSGNAIYNSANTGGAASVRIVNTTFSGNQPGSGIQNDGSSLQLGSSILDDTSLQNNNSIQSLGYNLSRDNGNGFLTAVGDQINTNPMIGPLQMNGGQTPMHALTIGSSAINAGTNFSGLPTDQRGTGFARTVVRPSPPNVADGTDIGAFELPLNSAPEITSANNAGFVTGYTNSFTVKTTGVPTPVVWATGVLPAGVTLNSNGVMSGAAPAGTGGVYPLTVYASNGVPPVATQSFTLSVAECATLSAQPRFNTNGLGWFLNGEPVNGPPYITNNVLTLTDLANGENRGGWFGCQLYIGGFDASFTYQDVAGNGAQGMAFVIQGDPRGTAALGEPGEGLGYSGITPSVAVLLNIYSGAPGGASGLMLGVNGVGALDDSGNPSGNSFQSTAPVNLDAGDPIAVSLGYTSSVFYVSLKDTVTSASFQTNFPVDIVGTLGTNFAWVGFTASEGVISSHQIVSNFSYLALPALAIKTVQNILDSGAGSLRDTIANASTLDTVTFASNVTGTIKLASGQLTVGKGLTIVGPGANLLALDGNGSNRVLYVSSGLPVSISGLTITNGHVGNPGTAGGIHNDYSTLTLSNLLITGNNGFNGGGIYNNGVGGSSLLEIFNCTISGNSAVYGGALDNDGEGGGGSAVARIYNSTISGNSSGAIGGAIYNLGFGTAIGSLSLLNCTLNQNHSGSYNDGIDNDGFASGIATLNIGSTILNANLLVNPDSGGTITSLGYNLSSDNGSGFLTTTGDQTNTDPVLGPLQLNGGQTPTHALLSTSPAIDAGANFSGLATDQRGPGFARTVDISSLPNAADGTDIGAFELQESEFIAPLLKPRPSFNTNGLGWVLNGDTVNGGPTIVNNVLTLTDGSSGENRSAWFFTPLYVGGFQAYFTYQDIGGNGADGAGFVIQTDPRATSALGQPGGGLAYSDITPSVAVLLNIYSGSPGGPSGVLLGTNGVGAYDGSLVLSGMSYQSTAPVNLDAGNPIAVSLRYTGGILQVSLIDTVTSANFQTNIPVNIPAFVGTNAAWVGITGSEGGAVSHQIVSNFNYRPLPVLSIIPGQAGSLVFTWPAVVYGFALQSNSNLNNPAGWAAVAATVTQTNNLNQVTSSLPAGTQFYRLLLP